MIPFVVTINWANAVLSVIMLVTTLLGLSFLQLILLVAGVVLSINIARLVMTLRAMQIVLLIVVQAVGLVAAQRADQAGAADLGAVLARSARERGRVDGRGRVRRAGGGRPRPRAQPALSTTATGTVIAAASARR